MKKNTGHILLSAFVVVALFVVVFFSGAFIFQNENAQEFVRQFGYAGIILIAFISSIDVIVPFHYSAFVPIFLSSGFPFWGIVPALIVGVTLGDMVSYAIGGIGRKYAEQKNSPWFQKLEAFIGERRTLIFPVLFLWALVVPFPNEVLIIPLALSGIRLLPIFLTILLGNTIHVTLVSFGVANVFSALFG